jgi:RNA 2',3'-cyclic 3'-phosphodiesterase
MPAKTHHSAIAVVPLEEVWGPIQEIRRQHDRQIRRWMQHINLLYPFRPHEAFASVAPRLVAACAAVAPFEITLGEFCLFRHGSGRCTLWLAPQPQEQLRHLHAALLAGFPDFNELSRFPSGFTPHLSVGQFASIQEGERTRDLLQAG